MSFKLIILIAIIYFIVKHKKRRKGRKRVRTDKRIMRNDLSSLRSRYQMIINYFDPKVERHEIASAIHQLMNPSGMTINSYEKRAEVLLSIIISREKDAELIRNLPRLKDRYGRTGDTFSDTLREDIDTHMERADRIMENEYFASGIDELKVIVRYLYWLVRKGEEGRDNSVHWAVESADKLESIRKKVVDERGMWKVLGNSEVNYHEPAN